MQRTKDYNELRSSYLQLQKEKEKEKDQHDASMQLVKLKHDEELNELNTELLNVQKGREKQDEEHQLIGREVEVLIKAYDGWKEQNERESRHAKVGKHLAKFAPMRPLGGPTPKEKTT